MFHIRCRLKLFLVLFVGGGRRKSQGRGKFFGETGADMKQIRNEIDDNFTQPKAESLSGLSCAILLRN